MNLPQNKVCSIPILHGANMMILCKCIKQSDCPWIFKFTFKTLVVSVTSITVIRTTVLLQVRSSARCASDGLICSIFYAFHHPSFQSCQTLCCCDILRGEEVRAQCLSTALHQSVQHFTQSTTCRMSVLVQEAEVRLQAWPFQNHAALRLKCFLSWRPDGASQGLSA